MKTRVRGFSLLEAIIALLVVSSAVLGAYSWVGSNIQTLNRVRDLALEESATRHALDQLQQTELALLDQGEMQWRGYRIQWQAEPVEPTRRGRTAVGGNGLYELTLYHIALSIFSDERLIAMPELRLVQYQRAPQQRPGQ